MTWQTKARALAFGQRRKVKHCASDISAYINNGPQGVSLHCFRCGINDFEPHGRLSAAEYLRMQAVEVDAIRTGGYPEVMPLYGDGVPSPARVWVLKAGISPERATDKYGFGWSADLQRVIVPVLHDGTPTGVWLGRNPFDADKRPKYLMPKGSAGATWRGSGGGGPVRDGTARVCVVEDVLSAIRITESGYDAVAVLGTTINTETGTYLSDRLPVGWFDGDRAGQDAWVKLRKILAPYGVDPLRIVTDKDPKNHNTAEIAKLMEAA